MVYPFIRKILAEAKVAEKVSYHVKNLAEDRPLIVVNRALDTISAEKAKT